MARKPLTYAHRRKKNRKESVLSPSVHVLADHKEQLTRTGSNQRTLKRSRHPSNLDSVGFDENVGQVSKKAKLSAGDVQAPYLDAGMSLDETLHDPQTPEPTYLSQGQIFRLKTSRGIDSQYGKRLSPVPLAVSHLYSVTRRSVSPCIAQNPSQNPKSSHRTSSSSLKENDSASLSKDHSSRKHKLRSVTGKTCLDNSLFATAISGFPEVSSTILASPFTSQPPSPHGTRGPGLRENTDGCKTHKTAARHPLTDTRFNPNIPARRLKAQTLSTTNSPTERSPRNGSFRARRPSAPSTTAIRPGISSWLKPSVTSGGKSKRGFFDSDHTQPLTASVDFNRPPSQLSYNFTYDANFFCDALQSSTPFGRKTQRSVSGIWGSFEPSGSADEEDNNQTSLQPSDMQITHPLSLAPDFFGSWINDSLISPPPPLPGGAYKRPEQPKSEVAIDSIMDDTLGLDDVSYARGISSISTRRQSAGSGCEENLQELFDGLKLEPVRGLPGSHLPRTRSLGCELERPRDRQSLQSSADIPTSGGQQPTLGCAGRVTSRNRSGTIRASDLQASQRPLSTSSIGPRRTRSGTVVQGSALSRRERSGTIIAQPPSSTLKPAEAVSDIGMQEPPEGSHRDSDVALMSAELSDDELLLQGTWLDDERLVMEPPSLKFPRRSGRKIPVKGVHRWKNSRSTQSSSASHATEDNDDPLLLK